MIDSSFCSKKHICLTDTDYLLGEWSVLCWKFIACFSSDGQVCDIDLLIKPYKSQYIYLRKCKFNPSFNKIKNFCLWIPSSFPVRARNAWSSEFTKIKVSKQKIISYICWFVQIDFVLVKKFTSSKKICQGSSSGKQCVLQGFQTKRNRLFVDRTIFGRGLFRNLSVQADNKSTNRRIDYK